jgi:hypothetical protein
MIQIGVRELATVDFAITIAIKIRIDGNIAFIRDAVPVAIEARAISKVTRIGDAITVAVLIGRGRAWSFR